MFESDKIFEFQKNSNSKKNAPLQQHPLYIE